MEVEYQEDRGCGVAGSYGSYSRVVLVVAGSGNGVEVVVGGEREGGVEQILAGSKKYLAAHQNWRCRRWREGKRGMKEKEWIEGVWGGK